MPPNLVLPKDPPPSERNSRVSYWQELIQSIGAQWNRFWFTPREVRTVCLLRLLVGLAAMYYVLSFTTDLVRWFGPDGLLPIDTVQRLETDPLGNANTSLGRWSFFDFATQPNELWGLHAGSLVVLTCFTVGLFSRITSVLSLVVVLSYLHRAPLLSGQFEAVLTLLMVYLCLAPTGATLSLDAWWNRRRKPAAPQGESPPAEPVSIMANVSLRLIQVHLAALYLLIGLSMLSGTYGSEYDPTWWRGEALWWLIARSESRIVDLSFLNSPTAMYLVNLWTHVVVALNLAFGILIWNRMARPMLLVLTAISWTALALVTGLVSYCLIMVVAGIAFVSPQRIAAWTRGSAA